MEDLIGDSAKLIEVLAELGGRTSNATLRAKLSWDPDHYFTVRNNCRAAGLVGLARGRGGVVILTDAAREALPAAAVPDKADETKSEEVAYEAEYYLKLLPTIQRDWVESEGFDQSVVEVTASRRVRGAGRWTVPDIVVVGKTIFQFVPSFVFTVQSLEIKRFEVLDSLGVFEALNHRRAAHHSYLVVVNYPLKPKDADREKIGQIEQLCFEHDIGLALVPRGCEANYEEWQWAVEPTERHEPNGYNLDSFFKQYVSPETRDAVSKMVR